MRALSMNTTTVPFACALLLLFTGTLRAADKTLTPAQAKALQAWKNAVIISKKAQTEKEGALVLQLYEKIVAADDQISEAEMKVYTNTISVPDRGRFGYPHISGTNAVVVSVMVPIRGGEF